MLNIVKMKINSITLFIIKKITLEINTLIKEDHISGKKIRYKHVPCENMR